MAAHVAAHRWADAWAGRLPEAEVAEMGRHADACAPCARVRERITRTSSETFPALRAQKSPDLPWDSVRARVHWELSHAKRQQPRDQRMWWIGAGALAAGAAVLAVASGPMAMPARGSAPAHAVEVASGMLPRTETATARSTPLVGLVSRLAGDVMIDGLRTDGSAFERALGPGTVIATGQGRVDVQFGDASAFALGPSSRLELRKFDSGAIELAVDGTVDVMVAPRAAEQRFVVLAGDETIEVRGTQFRVAREADGVRVACRHGLVAVHDARGDREVGATRGLEVARGTALAQPRALSGDELSQLAAATPVTVPLWSDALAQTSAPLEIASAARRAVRVDGVELGDAPLRVRVMPGRHTVEAADRAGRFVRADWVDVSAKAAARLDVRSDDAPVSAGSRKRELDAGIASARSRLARCTRAMAKAGVTDTFVQIEISVDGDGALEFLNVLDTDLPSATSECVQSVLRDIRFGNGVSASWREKIEL
jgi:ferric-dicitrate binding protein FerR (iron transport regulator)